MFFRFARAVRREGNYDARNSPYHNKQTINNCLVNAMTTIVLVVVLVAVLCNTSVVNAFQLGAGRAGPLFAKRPIKATERDGPQQQQQHRSHHNDKTALMSASPLRPSTNHGSFLFSSCKSSRSRRRSHTPGLEKDTFVREVSHDSGSNTTTTTTTSWRTLSQIAWVLTRQYQEQPIIDNTKNRATVESTMSPTKPTEAYIYGSRKLENVPVAVDVAVAVAVDVAPSWMIYRLARLVFTRTMSFLKEMRGNGIEHGTATTIGTIHETTIRTVSQSFASAENHKSSISNNIPDLPLPPPPPTTTTRQEQHQAASDLNQIEKLRREQAVHLSQSFVTRDFVPAWYGTNPHVQTIVGVLFRGETKYASPNTRPWNFLSENIDNVLPTTASLQSFQWDERQRMDTPDGDFFDIDWKFIAIPNDGPVSGGSLEQAAGTQELRTRTTISSATLNATSPLVLICHGLQSSSDSPLVKDMATAYNNVGMDAACINFRGCSGEVNRAPFGYHLSFTKDLEQTVAHFSSRYPHKPIYLSGFSLGANVVTKFLADQGGSVSERYNVYGAAINALPFNLSAIHGNINDPGISKVLYGDRLLKSMVDRIKSSVGTCQYPFSMDELNKCETIRDMENLVVCSLFEQFTDAYDYYNQSSTISILDQVTVPQLIIQALDDPFLLGNTNPPNDPTSPLRIHYTQYGGHCGYILHQPEQSLQKSSDEPLDDTRSSSSSWMPTELARYLKHVHDGRTTNSRNAGSAAAAAMETMVEKGPRRPESAVVTLEKVQDDDEVYVTVPDLVQMNDSRADTASVTTTTALRRLKDDTYSDDAVATRRLRSIEISNAFETREFTPAWYATNPHVQTILGVLAREESMYATPSFSLFDLARKFLGGAAGSSDTKGRIESFQWDKRQRMETPDGDFFDVDYKYSDSNDLVGRPSDQVPLVLICHGLQASSDSPLVKDMVLAYNNIGLDAACINFRGCSGTMNRKACGYHAHFTDDLQQMARFIATEYPTKPMYLSGFSLGANVVTKFLADVGDRAMDEYHIYGAAVNAVPFDMTKVYPNLNEPCFSQKVYGSRLLESMKKRIAESYETVNYPFALSRVQEWKTIMDVENDLICSSFGFDDAFDYYNKSSTVNMLHQVAVPQLIVQALDDPFFQGNTNPQIEKGSLPLRIQYTKHGGHCGYVFHSDRSTATNQDENRRATVSSWMPTELARFLDHVHQRSFPVESSLSSSSSSFTEDASRKESEKDGYALETARATL